MKQIAIVSLVNDREQFAACQESLRRVADPGPEWLMVEPNKHGWNAAQGLNHGLDALDAEWVVCLHQDVLFPVGFWQQLTAGLAALGDDVALAGLVGCERSGRFRGHIVDPNGHCSWPSLPARVLALDEVLIAVRKASGLRFDPEVPGFHCYGADLCFEADRRGLTTMAIDAPLVHLSTGKLDENYERASQWLMAKWGARYGYVLPMPALLLRDDAKAGLVHRTLHRWRRRGSRLSRNTNPCAHADCRARALGESAGVQARG
ncbi:MAG: glycosyltransferase [Planctomycetes bacterium]|nr:glycosyltransferase [Planctomycetota bacterium]